MEPRWCARRVIHQFVADRTKIEDFFHQGQGPRICSREEQQFFNNIAKTLSLGEQTVQKTLGPWVVYFLFKSGFYLPAHDGKGRLEFVRGIAGKAGGLFETAF